MESNAHRLIGTRLGTCELKRLIGAGGMGVVFLARQIRPAREVAVKVLRSGVGIRTEENQEFLARFRREADVIAQLDHINILPIYEYGEQDGLAYLVAPYLEGGSLRDLLARRGPLPAQEALIYIEQAAAALEYAHRHNIIHRDVKPGNMLFHADGRLVLVDFGIAHIMRNTGDIAEGHDTLTSTGQFLGSVDYMAPEMVNGKQPDHRTDIYELGVVLFQMLSGRVPFQGSSAFMVAAQHVQDKPPSLTALNPIISPRVDAVVQKALAKDPDKRYSSVSEMAVALRQAVGMPSYPAASPITPFQGLTDAETALMPGTELAVESEPRYLNPGFTPRPGPLRPVSTPGISESTTTGRDHLLPASETSQNARQNLYQEPPAGRPARGGRAMGIVIAGLIVLLLVSVVLFGMQALKGTGFLASTPTHVPAVPTPVATTPATPLPSTPTPSPTPSSAQQAQAIIQHYYDDVNQRNYQGAYQFWGANYQQAHPYSQFAAGYATTQHVDIVFHTISAQADGSQMVNMTIYANDKTANGTKLSAFEGDYIVGQENGAWKLLNYNFNAVAAPATTVTGTPGATPQTTV